MFENIIGHEKEKKLLHNFLKDGTISHAYLFSGKSGIGKFKMAKEFAREILKTNNIDSCPDFKYIGRKEDKKDILVEQIRKEIVDDVYIAPISANKKVYIIDDAESLNAAAQNALLKTLEEPPKYVVIILISSNINSFLPTILSRVTNIVFNGIDIENVDRFIKNKYNIELSASVLEFIDGSIGTSINIIENKLIDEFGKVEKLYSELVNKNIINCFKLSDEIDFNTNYMLDYLEYMLYKRNNFTVIKSIENAKIRLKFNGNYDIIIDSMLLRIIDNI